MQKNQVKAIKQTAPKNFCNIDYHLSFTLPVRKIYTLRKINCIQINFIFIF